jgi:hypothetical protein
LAALVADGFSISTLTVTLFDVNNNFAVTANNLLSFSVTGPGSVQGTNPVNAAAGTATLLYRSGTTAGVSTITITGTGLVTGTTNVITVPGPAVKQLMTANPQTLSVSG